MKKIVTFILISSLLTLTFMGCKNDNSKSQNAIKNFLTAYYTVNQNDYDYYQKMINGVKEFELKDFNKIYEENSKKYKQYLSDKSYNAFYAQRLSYLRIAKAYNNNVFTKIKNMKISKENEDKTEKTIGYHYEIELNQINKHTKEIEIEKVTGNLTVINKNGYWKIVDVIGF